MKLAGNSRLPGYEIVACLGLALAVAALGAEGDTVIRDSECVGVSFPDFFVTLERLRGGGEAS